MPKESKRQRDVNGYMQVRDNPISKSGVFPYLGSEISGHELPPDEVFNVYRPAEELESTETIDSFKLMPFIDDHEVLGDGATAPERKGIQGYIGEQVRFEYPYLLSNIMIPSRAAQTAIDAGKIELSPAYRCVYERKDGIFEGAPYQFIQRNIRANHLALVSEGRTGPDVAVLDHRTITIDSKRLTPMEFTDEQMAQIKALLAELLAEQAVLDKEPEKEATADEEVVKVEEEVKTDAELATVEQQDAAEETLAVAEEASEAIAEAAAALEEVEIAAAEVVAAPTADSKAKLNKARGKLKMAQDKVSKAMAKRAPSMDGLKAELAALRKQIAKTAEPAFSADSMLGMIADRDALASKVSQFVGTFDHSRMTADGVAKYACEKVGLKPAAGTERIALDAWLHGRKPESARVISQDRTIGGATIDTLWEKK